MPNRHQTVSFSLLGYISCILIIEWAYYNYYSLTLKGLKALRSLLSPWIEPQAAATATSKQMEFMSWSPIHLEDHLLIFFCAIYICIGKHTVNGQYPSAPRSASMSLKNGIAIARTVATTTNKLLQMSLRKLTLNLYFPEPPRIIEYSSVTNFDFGHIQIAHDSNALNNGCEKTCKINLRWACSVLIMNFSSM